MRRGGAALLALAACAQAPGTAPPASPTGASEYLGVETLLLDDDLVSVRVAMRGAPGPEALDAYAACAAAQYALIRGYGFARHVRTIRDERSGIRRADAVYTVSAALPRGTRTIDAEVAVADCASRGIPTV